MERDKGSIMSSSTFGGANNAHNGGDFDEWVAFMRKRNGASLPYRLKKPGDPSIEICPSISSSQLSGGIQESIESGRDKSVTVQPCENQELSLWERLGKAAMLDIESTDFDWSSLVSLHHIKHTTSNADQSEDESSKAVEVTVNSGGVVFIALFDNSKHESAAKEGAAVIKIASSRMATQSERLGYEFARWLGVRTPQARLVHNSTSEWQLIKDAAENACQLAHATHDDVGGVACTEMLEALELSRCLFLMNYIHGLPLLEDVVPFNSRESAENTANALGKVLMLDLILRNEDRLRCRHLGWRGNYANLLVSDAATSENMDLLDESYTKRTKPDIKPTTSASERRATSVNGRIISDEWEAHRTRMATREAEEGKTNLHGFYVVAIDSGVPRRPPVGKRIKDQESYPKLVELILNDFEFSSNLLYDLSLGKLGFPGPEEQPDLVALPEPSNQSLCEVDMVAVVNAFRGGFKGAVRDLEGFHIFLLTLSQKLDGVFRNFISIMNKGYSGESDRDDSLDSPRSELTESSTDGSFEGRGSLRRFSRSGSRENFDMLNPPLCRESGSGRGFRGEFTRCNSNLRLTIKIRDFNKYAKMDADLNKEMEQWYEMLRNDIVKLCQDNDFNTGFFECTESPSAIDAYELKVRLEHILERITLISEAASTERPSQVTDFLYIGGALAAKSMYTLQQIGITHVLCLCSNEIGQAEFQNPSLFSYKNFSVTDNDDENISDLFDEACEFIENVRHNCGKVLVHCFEGRSRSATIVLTYLMVYKKLTLLEAWTKLKKVHRRAHPNDGFGKILVSLDKKLYGRASMQWQQKKPMIRVCPICGKNAGLSSGSLKLHLQKSHKRICTGSVDSAIAVEIQKALNALKISRGGSISPKHMRSQLPSLDEDFA
ncbi:dual specificity protein phosphatase family protein [Rhynchospora pubera]|uniref:Dual specificity protein phosphatase family protein n=1 Tax=Rhynchospora pubera TaxID=906938 RepID=A0AAV8C3L2_9POAL|nr:dual specificity protein phosphatase family protein [Rhynchospora pubera]